MSPSRIAINNWFTWQTRITSTALRCYMWIWISSSDGHQQGQDYQHGFIINQLLNNKMMKKLFKGHSNRPRLVWGINKGKLTACGTTAQHGWKSTLLRIATEEKLQAFAVDFQQEVDHAQRSTVSFCQCDLQQKIKLRGRVKVQHGIPNTAVQHQGLEPGLSLTSLRQLKPKDRVHNRVDTTVYLENFSLYHYIYIYQYIQYSFTPLTWPGMPKARNTKAGRSARSRPTKYAKPCLSGLAGSPVRTVPQKETKSPEFIVFMTLCVSAWNLI